MFKSVHDNRIHDSQNPAGKRDREGPSNYDPVKRQKGHSRANAHLVAKFLCPSSPDSDVRELSETLPKWRLPGNSDNGKTEVQQIVEWLQAQSEEFEGLFGEDISDAIEKIRNIIANCAMGNDAVTIPQIITLFGNPGCGKTSVADAACRFGQLDPSDVMRVRCEQGAIVPDNWKMLLDQGVPPGGKRANPVVFIFDELQNLKRWQNLSLSEKEERKEFINALFDILGSGRLIRSAKRDPADAAKLLADYCRELKEAEDKYIYNQAMRKVLESEGAWDDAIAQMTQQVKDGKITLVENYEDIEIPNFVQVINQALGKDLELNDNHRMILDGAIAELRQRYEQKNLYIPYKYRENPHMYDDKAKIAEFKNNDVNWFNNCAAIKQIKDNVREREVGYTIEIMGEAAPLNLGKRIEFIRDSLLKPLVKEMVGEYPEIFGPELQGKSVDEIVNALIMDPGVISQEVTVNVRSTNRDRVTTFQHLIIFLLANPPEASDIERSYYAEVGRNRQGQVIHDPNLLEKLTAEKVGDRPLDKFFESLFGPQETNIKSRFGLERWRFLKPIGKDEWLKLSEFWVKEILVKALKVAEIGGEVDVSIDNSLAELLYQNAVNPIQGPRGLPRAAVTMFPEPFVKIAAAIKAKASENGLFSVSKISVSFDPRKRCIEARGPFGSGFYLSIPCNSNLPIDATEINQDDVKKRFQATIAAAVGVVGMSRMNSLPHDFAIRDYTDEISIAGLWFSDSIPNVLTEFNRLSIPIAIATARELLPGLILSEDHRRATNELIDQSLRGFIEKIRCQLAFEDGTKPAEQIFCDELVKDPAFCCLLAAANQKEDKDRFDKTIQLARQTMTQQVTGVLWRLKPVIDEIVKQALLPNNAEFNTEKLRKILASIGDTPPPSIITEQVDQGKGTANATIAMAGISSISAADLKTIDPDKVEVPTLIFKGPDPDYKPSEDEKAAWQAWLNCVVGSEPGKVCKFELAPKKPTILGRALSAVRRWFT